MPVVIVSQTVCFGEFNYSFPLSAYLVMLRQTELIIMERMVTSFSAFNLNSYLLLQVFASSVQAHFLAAVKKHNHPSSTDYPN
jgi:hypothetical protein